MKPWQLSILFATALVSSGPAFAEYPDKPVRVVIGFAPGGASDLAFKAVQNEWSKHLGQPVVPDYKPGANGNIANETVANAAADGYTVLWANVGPLAINTYLYPNIKVDPAKAFRAVSQVTDSPLIVVVPKNSPYKTMGDLIAGAKSATKPLSYGSAGFGSSMHSAGATLSVALGVPMTHIPYKGSAPAIQDLLGGHLDFMIDSRSTTNPHIKEGTLRALAASGPTRVPDMPDLPTVAESGLPGFSVTTWQGVVVPAQTPTPIVNKLSLALRAALKEPGVQARFATLNTPLVGSTPEEFERFMDKERREAKQLVERAKLRIE